MHRPELSDSDEDEILYSEDEPRQSSESSSEESDEEWSMNWNDLECVDECGEDEDNDTPRKHSDSSSDVELNDLELDAVDELNEQSPSKSKGVERERRGQSEDDKNEDEKKEGDPWSRWVGGDGEEKKKEEGMKRGDEKKDERRERREQNRDEHRRDEKREHSRREEGRPTLAELVLKGKMSGGEATRDRRSRAVRNSPSRRRKTPPRRDRDRRGLSPPSRRHESDRKGQRSVSPLTRHPPSPPVRKDRRSPSPPIGDRRRDRSPHRRAPSPSHDRRRNGSPIRKERRVSPSNREKREDVSRRDRSSLLPHKYSLPRLSSPNRQVVTRDRSPVTGKRDRDSLHKVSSPNRVKIGERSVMRRESPSRRDEREERKEKRRDKSRSPLPTRKRDIPSLLDVAAPLPSLLDVNIPPPIHPKSSRMEGRVKRDEKKEEKKEERPKERIERDARDEKTREEKKEEKTDTREEMEKKEERKRHIPIVWNDKESDATKKYRSVGHVKGVEMAVRKENGEGTKEETRKEKNIAAIIPSSMMARIGKCSHDSTNGSGFTVRPHKFEVEPKKSVDSPPPSVSLHKGQVTHKIVGSAHPRLQPTEVVRIIRNDEAAIRHSIQRKKSVEERSEDEGAEEDIGAHMGMDEGLDDDESGWLSATLQQDASGISMDERMEKRKADPSSAALRLFGRAAASAASSSTLKDARPTISKGGRVTRDTLNTIEERIGGSRKNKKKRIITDEIIEMRPLLNDKSGQNRRRTNVQIGVNKRVSQSGLPRLLETYY